MLTVKFLKRKPKQRKRAEVRTWLCRIKVSKHETQRASFAELSDISSGNARTTTPQRVTATGMVEISSLETSTMVTEARETDVHRTSAGTKREVPAREAVEGTTTTRGVMDSAAATSVVGRKIKGIATTAMDSRQMDNNKVDSGINAMEVGINLNRIKDKTSRPEEQDAVDSAIKIRADSGRELALMIPSHSRCAVC